MPVRGERLQEHAAYPDMFFARGANDELVEEILSVQKGVFKGRNITMLDVRNVPRDITHDRKREVSRGKIIDYISAQLNIEPSDLDDERKAEELFERINSALNRAKLYITQVLKQELPSSVSTLQVRSKEELIALVRNATLFSRSSKKLTPHLGYCALIKAALGVLELDKPDAGFLRDEMEWLQRFFIEPANADNKGNPLLERKPGWSADDRIPAVVLGIHPPCDVVFSCRDKTAESQWMKYEYVPESTAERARKDEIAMRIEVRRDRIGDVLNRIIPYCAARLRAENLRIENKNMFSHEDFGALFEGVRNTVPRSIRLERDHDPNPRSSAKFQVLQITGHIDVAEEGKSGRMRHPRSFEIQIVEPENRNNVGLASDGVYRLRKMCAIMTRFFGSFDGSWLRERGAEIAGGMSPEKLVSEMLREGCILELPNVSDKYADRATIERWLEIDGLITDERIRKRYQHALNKAPQKDDHPAK